MRSQVWAILFVGVALVNSEVNFEMIGEGKCIGDSLGDAHYSTRTNALAECVQTVECAGYWFGSTQDTSTYMDPDQPGWAQMFSSVGALVTPDDREDYDTEHCYEKGETQQPTNAPTDSPTASPTFLGPSCPNGPEQIALDSVVNPHGTGYCNLCRCACSRYANVEGFYDNGNGQNVHANRYQAGSHGSLYSPDGICVEAALRCTAKDCPHVREVITNVTKCEHVKCSYQGNNLVNVRHHHLETHLNVKCAYNRLQFELHQDEDKACNCMCWDKVEHYDPETNATVIQGLAN